MAETLTMVELIIELLEKTMVVILMAAVVMYSRLLPGAGRNRPRLANRIAAILLFGAFSIFGTYAAVTLPGGGLVTFRDLGPMMGGLVGGPVVGLGAGLIFLLEYLDNSFKSTEEIEADLGLPVLAAIPAFVTSRDMLKRRINLVFSLLGVAFTGCLALGFTALCFLSDKRSMQIMNKLGSVIQDII